MTNALTAYNRNTQVAFCKPETAFLTLFDCDNRIVSIQLSEREQNAIVLNFKSGMHQMAAELTWIRTMSVLRKRLSFLGEEFIGDMLGYDKPVYSDNLTEIEAISLNYDVGFLRRDAKMELMHNSEQIKEYVSRQYQLIDDISMSKTNAMALIHNCIEFVLSDVRELSGLEFISTRERLKSELLSKDSDIIVEIQNGEYFGKRTILRSLINMARTENEKEKPFVYHNMNIIIPIIWKDLSESDKYSFGTTYAEISSSEKKDYVNVIKKILYNVQGYDYVPENLKSNSFIATAKNLINIHNGYNNFYNEPLAAKLLSSMGTIIPDPAIYECINAVLICITGNKYGVSDGAQIYLKKILDNMTALKWLLYFKDLPKNSDMMYQLGYVDDNVVSRWCDVVTNYQLNKLVINDSWTNQLVMASLNKNIVLIRTIAKKRYESLQR